MATSRPKYLPDNRKFFPNRNKSNHFITSDQGDSHNCIAYAVADYDHNWWPRPKRAYIPGFGEMEWEKQPQYRWPNGCREDETLEAFIEAFGTRGFTLCPNDGKFEKGFIKVALYAYANDFGMLVPTHAAVQTRQGKWRSKMSADHDIEHTLEALEGPAYGKVVVFLIKQI